MGAPNLYQLILISILFLQLSSTQIASTSPTRPRPRPPISPPRIRNKNTSYIKTSCHSTLYPNLCYRSLSIYAAKIKANPELLARVALNVSLAATKSTGRLVRRLRKIRRLRRREVEALVQCAEVVGDSVEELRRSVREMGQMGGAKGSRFMLLLNDVETWVSASLTDDDTCMEGIEEQEKKLERSVKILVRRHILRISRLTSNALALVNAYASSRPNFL